MSAPVPSRICPSCGEYEPHYCAPVVTWKRQKWTGKRVVTITDRDQPGDSPSVRNAAARRGNDGKRPERVEDYAELRSWGESPASAAARLGVSERTAWRYEAEIRRAAA